MPKNNSRKDDKGRVLHKGEGQRTDTKMYYYSFRDMNKERRMIYAKTLQELRQIEAAIIHDQYEGFDPYAAGKLTLDYAFDRYIGNHRGLREQTVARYKYVYSHYVHDAIGSRPVGKIKYSDIKAFYISLFDRGLAFGSVSGVNTILHPAFDMLMKDEVIRRNPADKVLSELYIEFKARKKVRHALTLQEQRIFLNAVLADPVYKRYYPFMVVLFGTGCRIGELGGLTWDRLDFEKRLITIDRSLAYRQMESGHMEMHLVLPKTEKGIRTIPMLDQVCDAFREEFAFQEQSGHITTVVDGVDGFVFGGFNNQVMTTEVANRMIRKVVDNYNDTETANAKKEKRDAVLLPQFSCHVCRHTFCTRMCEAGVNIKVLMEIMGHEDVKTTLNIYAEVTNEKLSETVTEIGNVGAIL